MKGGGSLQGTAMGAISTGTNREKLARTVREICKIGLTAKYVLWDGLERCAVQHVVRPFYVVRSSWAALTSAARRHAAKERCFETCADYGPGVPYYCCADYGPGGPYYDLGCKHERSEALWRDRFAFWIQPSLTQRR